MSLQLKVTSQVDCGNAPRKEIIRDFTIAIATKDSVRVQEWVVNKLVWNNIGVKQIIGKEDFLENFSSHWTDIPVELYIEHIITHGKTAATNGHIKFEDGRVLAFCDIYEFVSAGKESKIKEITSYRI